MNQDIIAFKNELLLLRWGDNSRDGMTVTFQLPGEYDTHPFKHSATGKQSGKRYAAVLVEINDDETPVVQPPKGGPLSKEAAGLSKREDFQAFMGVPPLCEEQCAGAIRDACGVKSRAEIDHSDKARSAFYDLKRDFLEWKRREEMAVVAV